MKDYKEKNHRYATVAINKAINHVNKLNKKNFFENDRLFEDTAIILAKMSYILEGIPFKDGMVISEDEVESSLRDFKILLKRLYDVQLKEPSKKRRKEMSKASFILEDAYVLSKRSYRDYGITA